eukprot:SAG31_NODE_32798_length_351_cov_1.027778_1_plen_85_part_10
MDVCSHRWGAHSLSPLSLLGGTHNGWSWQESTFYWSPPTAMSNTTLIQASQDAPPVIQEQLSVQTPASSCVRPGLTSRLTPPMCK